jgi:hypothetical protein
MRSLIRWCLLGTFLLPTASARIGSAPIEQLIAFSDAIVVAKVSELLPTSTSEKDLVYATASIQRTLKGSLADSFMFRASSGWICDTSGAVKDETALFFLGRGDDGTFYIQWAGRGRMPLREANGKTYVTLWDNVVLPKDAPTIAGPDPRYGFIKSIELSYVEGLIRQQLRVKAHTEDASLAD